MTDGPSGSRTEPVQTWDEDDDRIAVSFVVIAFNEERGIGETLRSIGAQSDGGDIEIVVVDDGSADRTSDVVALIAEGDPRVRLVTLPENRGRGFARAVGIKSARGELIATVDSDIVLAGGWLARCRDALRDADAVAGTAVPDGDVAYVYRRFGLEPRRTAHTIAVTGSNALYRAQLFGAVAFDPTLREGEDIALNHALEAAGLRLHSVPGLFVRHEERKSLRETLTWMFVSGRGATRQLQTYRELRTPDLAFFGFVATLVVAAAPGPRRWVRAGLPAGFLLAAATGHVGRAFVWTPRRWPTFAGAIVVDAAQLACYFAGRAAGPPPREAPAHAAERLEQAVAP